MELIADCSRGVYAPRHAAEVLAAQGWPVQHDTLVSLNPDRDPDDHADAIDELTALVGPDDRRVLCTENGDWFTCTAQELRDYEYAKEY